MSTTYTRPDLPYIAQAGKNNQRYKISVKNSLPLSSESLDADINYVIDTVNQLSIEIGGIPFGIIPGSKDINNKNKVLSTDSQQLIWMEIGTNQISDKSINQDKLQDQSVDTRNIVPTAITNTCIADKTITSNKIKGDNTNPLNDIEKSQWAIKLGGNPQSVNKSQLLSTDNQGSININTATINSKSDTNFTMMPTSVDGTNNITFSSLNNIKNKLGITTNYNLEVANKNAIDVNKKAIDKNTQAISASYNQIMPVGSVISFAGSTAPKGFFECNGSKFNTGTYPQLKAVLQSGAVPDLRGQFVRGWDHGKGVDKNRNIRSSQGDAIRNIKGKFGRYNGGTSFATGPFQLIARGRVQNSGTGANQIEAYFDASRVVPTAAENRPKNIALMYIIKHD